MNEKNFCIPAGKSRDPDHWADLSEMPAGENNDPEVNQEIRILMTTVALLHGEFPDRHCFPKSEVDAYRPETLKKYPELKGFQ